jgi:hypothetical protein
MATPEPTSPVVRQIEDDLDALEDSLLQATDSVEVLGEAAVAASAGMANLAAYAGPGAPMVPMPSFGPPPAPPPVGVPAAPPAGFPPAPPVVPVKPPPAPAPAPPPLAVPVGPNAAAWMGPGAPVVPMPTFGPAVKPAAPPPAAVAPGPPPTGGPGAATSTTPSVPGALPPRPAPVALPTPPPETPGTGVSGALSSLREAVGSTTMAFSLASGAVLGLVQAFSPATVQQFMMALNDLAAVVGSALAPVLQGLTTIAREVGAVLLPVAEQLQPVFTQLMQTVLQVVLPVLDNWASVLQAMVPFIAFVGEVFSNIGTVARVAATFMAGVIEQVKQWVAAIMPSTDGVKSFTDGLRDAIQEIAKAALLLVGYLAKLMGATGFLEGMLKSLGKAPGKPGMADTKDPTGYAAAQQARFTTAMDFGKSVATAAFTATGGVEGPKDTNAWLQDVVKELEDIKAGRDNAVDNAIRAVEKLVEDQRREFERYLTDKWPELVAAIKGEMLDSVKRPAGFTIKTLTGGFFG